MTLCAHSQACRKKARTTAPPAGWRRRLFVLAGLASLLWFLVRVLPKPARAAYPCQRIAAPLASTFVAWLVGVLCATAACRHGRRLLRLLRSQWAVTGCALAAVAALAAAVGTPGLSLPTAYSEDHDPIGVARGIHPGRVVWVHAPEATDWDGFESPEHWWQTNHTDLAVVEDMVSTAVRAVAGEGTDASAWDALFRQFNRERGKGYVGYRPGERIAIKINLAACNARGGDVNPATYAKHPAIMNRIDNSPQMILALLRQLVNTVGVAPADITMGDPTGMIPNYMWNMLQPEFPGVRYLDNYGGSGRIRAQFTSIPLFWSTSGANGKLLDFLSYSFGQADYIINFALLKGHSSGITACGKNHFGSLIRCPDGYLRDVGYVNYYNTHLSLPNHAWTPGTGHYRAHVDLMGHPELGAKTLLYLIDGLFGGYYWEAHPVKWLSPPFGDGVTGDWPSSLFASQDPVAIDSVAHDFLKAEWPDVVSGGAGAPGSLQGGAEDYLHEAAMAHDPPSDTFYDPGATGVGLASLGVHEHWNSAAGKQYSRNLGQTNGIELVALTADSLVEPEPNPGLALASIVPSGALRRLGIRDLVTGVLYTVRRRPDLQSGTWQDVGQFIATSHEMTVSVLETNDWPAVFYRVVAD